MGDKNLIEEELLKSLKALDAKYQLTGQNLQNNLEGLLHSNYLKYWNYVHLDTLLSLQTPRTDFPDEMVFIIYHQITELYFKLILWEIEQIQAHEKLTAKIYLDKIERIYRICKALSQSFELMWLNMEADQFRQFRMALLPASGFQSVQFRKIELMSTDLIHLLEKSFQNELTAKGDVEEVIQFIYWKNGATDEATQQETITAKHFQEKYLSELIAIAHVADSKNLWQIYKSLKKTKKEEESISQALRNFDYSFNVEWRLAHLKSAVKYLKSKEKVIKATGGTNWQKYLPPNIQKIIFYPELWSEEELKSWGVLNKS